MGAVSVPELGEAAYPVLLKHIRLDYPDRILQGITRAFSKDVALRHWEELLGIYLRDGRPEARDGVAATLSGCAAQIHYDDLLTILKNETLGETRIYFLRPVNRIGNRMRAGGGREVIERFANDPQLGNEAQRILQGRRRND